MSRLLTLRIDSCTRLRQLLSGFLKPRPPRSRTVRRGRLYCPRREKSIVLASAGADWGPFAIRSRWPEAPTCVATFADRPRPRSIESLPHIVSGRPFFCLGVTKLVARSSSPSIAHFLRSRAMSRGQRRWRVCLSRMRIYPERPRKREPRRIWRRIL
jgi:hypothetical protein